ncbi:MAG: hypothetical protein ACRDPM_25045 [Solirubrobacteraceae bacterium]
MTSSARRLVPRRLRRAHFGLVFLAILIVLVVILLVFAHRHTPCEITVTGRGKGANIEQCSR